MKDDVVVEVDADEIPVLDGSASPFIFFDKSFAICFQSTFSNSMTLLHRRGRTKTFIKYVLYVNSNGINHMKQAEFALQFHRQFFVRKELSL